MSLCHLHCFSVGLEELEFKQSPGVTRGHRGKSGVTGDDNPGILKPGVALYCNICLISGV